MRYAGRDHWPHCYSVLMAGGGGVRGGAVFGSSDKFVLIRILTRSRPVTLPPQSSGGWGSTMPLIFSTRPEDLIALPLASLFKQPSGNPRLARIAAQWMPIGHNIRRFEFHAFFAATFSTA